MKKLVSFILFYLLLYIANGQIDTTSNKNYILSGTIVNGITNEILSGANIITTKGVGTKSNEIGEFEIKVTENDTLKISFIGFKSIEYIAPFKEYGKYLIKFKLYVDSVNLDEIEIFPWPTYEEFKEAFLLLNKEDEKIKMEGVKMYKDRVLETKKPSVLNPVSFIYDKLFDKQAKLKRRLERNRETIRDAQLSD